MATVDNNTSRFTPVSHFFTDPAAITQTADQAFGPVSEDIFRLTTKFSVNADTAAYAICTGVVLVQPQTGNSGKVNLILRPFKQPITGFNIKYFVYRGLKADDFFDGDKVKVNDGSTSDFINAVNASFNSYYEDDPDKPDFLASFIGYDPGNQPDNKLISDLFFKVSTYTGTGDNPTETPESAFELPLIDIGATIGNFASGECGLDIVIDYGDYLLHSSSGQFVFDLAYGRAAESKLDLTMINDDFQEKLTKEQISQFIDTAAYYGFHSNNGIVYSGSAAAKITSKGLDVYTNIVQRFYTKNKLYIYIQGDRIRSYNFYNNYNIDDAGVNCIKLGISEDTIAESQYAFLGWPLLINDTGQIHDDSFNSIFLQFASDGNQNSVLFCQAGVIVNAEGNNFCTAEDLTSEDYEGLTKIIQLSNLNVNSEGNKLNIATFNILIYQGYKYTYNVQQSNNSDQNGLSVSLKFIDDFFVLDFINSALQFNNESSKRSTSFNRSQLISFQLDDINYGAAASQISVYQDQILEDSEAYLKRITYSSLTVDKYNDASLVGDRSAVQTQSVASGQDSANLNSNILPAPFFYNMETFTDEEDTFSGLTINNNDTSKPLIIVVGLTDDENTELNSTITDNQLFNVRLVFADASDDNEFVSAEGIVYKKYTLCISGEDTETGSLRLVIPSTVITVFTIDGLCYFSHGYSQYVVNDTSSNLSTYRNVIIS